MRHRQLEDSSSRVLPRSPGVRPEEGGSVRGANEWLQTRVASVELVDDLVFRSGISLPAIRQLDVRGEKGRPVLSVLLQQSCPRSPREPLIFLYPLESQN